MEERLQKILAQAGLCSRREAERWILAGRVTVNGHAASLGDRADLRRDKIQIDGKPIGASEEKKYLMLYKPRGYVTTMKDERGRKTVADLVRGCGARVVVPVRLLRDPCVAELLDMAAQQYGYGQPGVLRIPCDAGHFRRVVDGALHRAD